MPPTETWRNGGAPIMSWAAELEQGAREQMENIARLPFAHHHVALMPDAHQGYAMPIGGVLAAKGAVVPYAIGVDIGCGVALIAIHGKREEDLQDGDVKELMEKVRESVPVGNGPQGGHEHDAPLPEFLDGPSPRIEKFVYEAAKQLGSLGGGNHFLELQAVAKGPEKGKLYFMIHSGSRSLGKKTCDYHVKRAQIAMERWHSQLPHKEVAYLPFTDPLGQDYLEDMNYCLKWAEENRRVMAEAVESAVFTTWGVAATMLVDCHHNFAAMENHYGENVLVHRKGAVRARAGETVLIPGSMSTGSYIAEGKGNKESFDTCQHGAGRARSRAATRKMITKEELTDMMAAAGVYLTTPGDVRDESAIAYKDIEEVMRLSGDLIQPLVQMKPLGVVKG